MNLSPLAVGLIVAGFTALLAGLGWLIQSQISTNKGLSSAITDLSKSIAGVASDFKVAMTSIEERSNTQKTLCQLYRGQIDVRNKGIENRISKVEQKLENKLENTFDHGHIR
jgi:hypothetical protein